MSRDSIFRLMFDPNEAFKNVTGYGPNNVFLFQELFVKRNPSAASGLIKAWNDAIQFIGNNHPNSDLVKYVKILG